MCAAPAPEGASTAPRRTRITPIQWIGLAVVALLLLDQLGFLRTDEGGDWLTRLQDEIPLLVSIVIAVTVHEFSHALVATWFGDDLPRRMGRLTLNPLAHLDPIGSLLFLIARFGWGKPVPINPNAMTHPGLGWALSSAAGPISNLLTTVFAAVVLAVIGATGGITRDLFEYFIVFASINVSLAVFNLIPLAPLDGFGFVYGLSPRPIRQVLGPIQSYGPILLLALIFLPRLIPGFPPILGTVIGGFGRVLLDLLFVRVLGALSGAF